MTYSDLESILSREWLVTFLSFQTIIEIVVDNVNDNTPQFVDTPYETLINENATGGETFFVVSATDLDQGTFRRIEVWDSWW